NATALTPPPARCSRPAKPGSAAGSEASGPSPLGGDLALDPARVLLVLAGHDVELDDPFLPVERIAPPDRDVAAGHLDDVVTGARVAAQAQGGDGAGV